MVGGVIYYVQEINPTLLVALVSNASEEAKGTTQTEDSVHQVLDYCATHPNEKLRYHVGNMILIIHIDSYYLSEIKARSRSGGHLFMCSQNFKNNREINGAVHTVLHIIKNFMGSASEAEVGSLFNN